MHRSQFLYYFLLMVVVWILWGFSRCLSCHCINSTVHPKQHSETVLKTTPLTTPVQPPPTTITSPTPSPPPHPQSLRLRPPRPRPLLHKLEPGLLGASEFESLTLDGGIEELTVGIFLQLRSLDFECLLFRLVDVHLGIQSRYVCDMWLREGYEVGWLGGSVGGWVRKGMGRKMCGGL